MPERREGDRITVTGKSSGNHFPRVQSAMNDSWEANGMGPEGRFEIEGSVYGRNLRFRGPGLVRGSVLGRGDLLLENTRSTPQRFLAGVSSSGSLVCTEWAGALSQTSFGDVKRSRYFIRGDVQGDNVVLDGAVVFGNVEGLRVRLSHSIVMGSVVAHESLNVRASSLLAYHAGRVSFEGPCSMLHAIGESENLPSFAPYVDLNGTSHPTTISLYPLVRPKAGSLFNTAPAPATLLSLGHDWVRVAASEKRPQHYVLSVMGRALNMSGYVAQIEHLYEIIRTCIEYEHYSPRDQKRIRKRWDVIATAEERWILEQTTGQPALDS
jgi:hypothetical protein